MEGGGQRGGGYQVHQILHHVSSLDQVVDQIAGQIVDQQLDHIARQIVDQTLDQIAGQIVDRKLHYIVDQIDH